MLIFHNYHVKQFLKKYIPHVGAKIYKYDYDDNDYDNYDCDDYECDDYDYDYDYDCDYDYDFD